MATWKKVLFEGDSAANLSNTDLTQTSNRTYTLNDNGFLKFQQDISGAKDLLILQTNSISFGATNYSGTVTLANSEGSLFLINGITLSTASLYHLFSGPYVEFTADTENSSSGDGSSVVLKRSTNSGVAADDMNVGVIKFQAENTANTNHEYARISVNASDVSAASEDAEMNFNVHVAGSTQEALSLKPTSNSDKPLYGIDIYGSSLRSWLTPTLLGPWTREDESVSAGVAVTVPTYLGSSSGTASAMNTDHLSQIRVIRDCYVTGISYNVDVDAISNGGTNISFFVYKNGSSNLFGTFNSATTAAGGENDVNGTYTVSSPYSGAIAFSAGDRLGLRVQYDNQYPGSTTYEDLVACLEITYA